MSHLPKLVTTNLPNSSQDKPLSASKLASPLTGSHVNNRPPLNTNDSNKSREKTKFKGAITKFMGNFNGSSILYVVHFILLLTYFT